MTTTTLPHRVFPKGALALGLGCALLGSIASTPVAAAPTPTRVDPSAARQVGRMLAAPRPYRLRMELQMLKTTDSNENTWPLSDNTEDEIYYSLAGAEVIGGQTISLQRKMEVRPNNPSKDVWEMGPNSNDVLYRSLFEGTLGGADRVALTLAINEQDNAQLKQLEQLIKDTASAAIAALAQEAGVSDFLGTGQFDDKQALDTLMNDSKALLYALNDKKDQPVGVAEITIRGGLLRVSGVGAMSQVLSSSSKSAELELTGSGSKYRLRLFVEDGNTPPPLTRVFLDRSSDKCGDDNLWVESKFGNVLLHKGDTKDVYVKSDVYKWHCGSLSSDDSSNAPDATNVAVTTRAPSGRDIKWEWYTESTAVADYK